MACELSQIRNFLISFGSIVSRNPKKVDECDGGWFIVTLNNLIGIRFEIFNIDQIIEKEGIDSSKLQIKELAEGIKLEGI